MKGWKNGKEWMREMRLITIEKGRNGNGWKSD